MSLVDDLLITIQDKSGITKEEILAVLEQSSIKKSALFSGIARLQSKGFIRQKATGYEITGSGRERINGHLDALIEFKQENRHWFLILIEIPEYQKLLREKLRFEFKKIGIGIIKRGVYIICASTDKRVHQILDNVGLHDQAYIIELSSISLAVIKKIARRAWDWDNLQMQYHSFIRSADIFLKEAKQFSREIARIEAKKLVFEFSKIVRKDPKINDQLVPANYLRSEAFKVYKQLQPFCY